jgi:hypothetical protein
MREVGPWSPLSGGCDCGKADGGQMPEEWKETLPLLRLERKCGDTTDALQTRDDDHE